MEIDSNDSTVLLEFREGEEVIAVPTLIRQQNQTYVYKWTVPNKEAEYQLLCWINDDYVFSSTYIYRKEPLKEQSNEEKEILNALEQKVYLNAQYEKNINEQNIKKDKKSSSKCCLLI